MQYSSFENMKEIYNENFNILTWVERSFADIKMNIRLIHFLINIDSMISTNQK